MSEATDVTPCDVAAVRAWDATADVIVVGFGAAGSTAAFTAADCGASVLVAEAHRRSRHGAAGAG